MKKRFLAISRAEDLFQALRPRGENAFVNDPHDLLAQRIILSCDCIELFSQSLVVCNF